MTDKIDDGGQAFPLSGHQDRGLTMREYFAGLAMQSLILNGATLSPEVPLSVRACEIADAMIAALKRDG